MDHSGLEQVSCSDLTQIQQYHQDCGLSGHILENLRVETAFDAMEEPPRAPTFDKCEAIGLRKVPCPFCLWKTDAQFARRKVLLVHRGRDTGQRILRHVPCRCWVYERFFSRWSGTKAMVPKKYRQFRLSTLAPCMKLKIPFELQEQVIFTLRKYPRRNYLFVGPACTGKTAYTTALFANALYEWSVESWQRGITTEAVWRVVTSDYLQQEHDFAIKSELRVTGSEDNERVSEATEPVVTRRKIKAASAAGLIPRLFLEEIDKTPKLTEFRTSVLFGLINECYEHGGQIVVNSNKSVAELIDHFGQWNGDALLRRFTNDDDETEGQTYNFYA